MDFIMGLKEVGLVMGLFLNDPILIEQVPFSDGQPEVALQQLDCLARTIYFEARDQDEKGQQAVGKVMLNRVVSMKYPMTLCEVMAEDRGPKQADCQFSFFCDGKPDDVTEVEAYEKALSAAVRAIRDYPKDNLAGATHYFAHELVNPHWSDDITLVAVVGEHTFMRE